MATTFKTLLNQDITSTKTLLHEAIPITGSMVSGTYSDNNIKDYSHAMFQSVYDYPYLSSSANHIFDITAGFATGSGLSASAPADIDLQRKKINMYNTLAQQLVGYDANGDIRAFDTDGDFSSTAAFHSSSVFFNFSRLLTKDEMKKGTFTITFATGGISGSRGGTTQTYGDYGAATSYKVNSPAGEYGLLYRNAAEATAGLLPKGLIFYQAGVVVLTGSVFADMTATVAGSGFAWPGMSSDLNFATASFGTMLASTASIADVSNGVRDQLYNISFNNTTELNSTIYFCRANNSDFNYSANPTYTSDSKIVVKDNNPNEVPKTYITTIGLYSADNELLAVAKLSEPLKKTPNDELTFRVRLDY
mgnify:FL=1